MQKNQSSNSQSTQIPHTEGMKTVSGQIPPGHIPEQMPRAPQKIQTYTHHPKKYHYK